MNTIIFATKNQGKLNEIRDIMAGYNIISMEEAGIDLDILEDGKTFEENAVKKATEIMRLTNKIVLADDSGLEIDFLNKEPGVMSARYMGEHTSYDIKNNKILELLKDVPGQKRTARFVCVIAAAFPPPHMDTLTTHGVIEGTIAYEIKGNNGFGYDPIFYVDEYNMTTAEMPSELKNSISHRGKALKSMKDILDRRMALL